MKSGTLFSARGPLVLDGRYITNDEIVVFIEIITIGDTMKKICFLCKSGLIRHKVRGDVDIPDCIRYWFYKTI